jgi:hypothetical protein
MLASLLLVALALRLGLAMRRARRLAARRAPDLRPRHVRLAKLAVTGVSLGFVAGPLSMLWLRERAPFATAHAFLGTATLALFAATYVLGRRLERHRGGQHDAHALFAVLAALLAGATAIAGFVLLP